MKRSTSGALAMTFRLLLLSGLVISCAQPGASVPAARCRAVLVASGQTLSIKAMIEGGSGHSIDGAIVTATTPANQAVLLEYDQTRGAYVGQVGIPPTGNYRIDFRSVLFGTQTLEVPFSSITTTPVLGSATDASGHSAFLAQALRPDQAISLTWNPCLGASVYTIAIRQGVTLLFSSTVSTPSLLLNPGSLAASGSVSVLITAQNITGDPVLVRSDFYSVSESAGSTFYLNLAP